ncbi:MULTISPECIES: E2/UBC family protein [Gammaproteobacteria]|uniref:E2/UBC family protein n=1 Tax=Gammaproteobacteria TaxID=1236 RepID=UPI001BD3FB12|nr:MULTISPECIES: E2/UBC family protein [Gammaproteobacteria]MCT8127547.1 ThiF family adenylyltransferase [Alishewanella sp. BS5-314]
MQEDLHYHLLCLGFERTKAQHIPADSPLLKHDNSSGFYVKVYSTLGGDFRVALRFSGDPHIQLPYAYVISYPEQYSGKLIPHINHGYYLCYIQEMEADWNPNDLQGTLQVVDLQIQQTLDSAVNQISATALPGAELEGEFAAYWLASESLYLLTDENSGLICRIAKAESNDIKNTQPEWIVSAKDQQNELSRWMEQRKLSSNGNTFVTARIKVKPNKLSGAEWPPKTFKSLLDWLFHVDNGAWSQVISHFVNAPVKKHAILLDVHNQAIIAAYVELDINAISLERFKNRPGKARKSTKYKDLAVLLGGRQSVKAFKRLCVTSADKGTILSRNRKRPEIGDLGKLRIALVGCGTIGGNLAPLLVRAGAGCGSGRLDLFDGDTYMPHNFSRHSLNTEHFGQNKATSLKEVLQRSTHFDTKIQAKEDCFPITPCELAKYDIVIDATGRPPVSKRLAHVVRILSKEKRPVLIHGYNDGNGRVSKVFVDDSCACYECLHTDPAFYRNGTDSRFVGVDLQSEKRLSCGSTFVPYDASVSVMTAGLMQDAVLQTLENKRLWTYNEVRLDGERSRRPSKIKAATNCRICNSHV